MNPQTADLILYNANVLTMDPRKPKAGLIAIKGERILGVGGNGDIELYKGTKTRVLDCRGKAVVPGFNDAHCHIFAFVSSLLSVDCSPSSVNSIAEIKAAIRRRAQATPAGSWITGSGYNEFYLAEKRHPTRWDLDEVAPSHPVRLLHRSGHACVLNSLALSLAGISRETPDPPGGLIDREIETGEPNGLLFEMNAYIGGRVVPPLTEEELKKGIGFASRLYLSCGITSVQDATASNDLAQWRIFHRFNDRGVLVSRISMMLGIDALGDFEQEGLSPGYGNSHLRLGAVKIVIDETTGALYPSQEELNQQVLQAHRSGFQVAIHAIEESSVDAAVTALEYALHQIPRSGHRHRVEHCSVCPPELMQRLRAIQAVVVTQPPFLYYSGERYLTEVSDSQLRWLYRIYSFQKNGLRPAASSDSPVVPNSPLIGIYAAVTRKAETGQVISAEERISAAQALDMYTIGSAYASFEEEIKGSIASGKLADLVVLSDDPTKVAPEEIKEIRVEKTIVGGKIVWEA